ncbi:maintenance of telomere capping protein 1 [Purpureocillium lavendulum]|uniref:Maintenance of telomere capping protein 1 n=1 Tax=Purpureocillium lavendulum TaxID=1247861 RepID=A0AB34FVX1_9HYPO|nr:maintenance of telomere capping protein 1 [Purpureocillium lavendulum]
MASKKSKATSGPAADDNLDELFSGIGDDAKAKKPTANPKSSKPAKARGAGDDDILADLESQLASEQPSSRPHTPRIKEGGFRRPAATPPAADDKPAQGGSRKSTDSNRSLRASFTPSATSSELHEAEKKGPVEQVQQQQEQQQQQQASGGGWWGGILSTASAAMKQAEAAVKEIQQNEEAKKWADQVKGLRGIDVGALRNYGE